MTRNRKMCVAVAKDVIAQLRLKRFAATPGEYVNVNSPELHRLSFMSETHQALLNSSFKEFFKNNKETICSVCALGAAFVSLVNIENECSINNVQNRVEMDKRLAKYFGVDNMSLMESAFERRVMASFGCNLSEKTLDIAAQWGMKYKDSTKRLRVIMLNIIRNNGDFKLPKKFLAKARGGLKRKSCSMIILIAYLGIGWIFALNHYLVNGGNVMKILLFWPLWLAHKLFS